MAKSKMYNGHKNKTHWNVSLWINNDESLYRLALDFINANANANRNDAARDMMLFLEQTGQDKTPDGFKYSTTAIRAAMVGM
ncbi:hypothetical protein ORC68_000289 [Escherichia coli]|nr:hypothetical protein [Escherichia coli]